MDLQSYIQLKEAYANVHAPREEVIIEVTNEEVDFFIDALLEEGYDLSEFTWEEIREAYLEEAENGMFGLGRMAGQIKRAGQKMFGNASQRNAAVSYEKSYNDINKRRGEGVGTRKTVTKGEIDAETAGRRKADPNYKPGQGVDSGQKLTATKPAEKKKPENNGGGNGGGGGGGNGGGGGGNGGGGGGGGGGGTQKVTPAKTAQQKADSSTNAQYDKLRKSDPAAAKKFGMDASRKKFGNQLKPKTPNPLMTGMRSSSTKPTTTPKPSTSSAGASSIGRASTSTPKPSTASSSGASSIGSAATSTPKPSTAPKPKATPIKSSRLNKALSSVGEEMEFDSFDFILEYLVDSGFPQQEALVIMAEMSEEKREEILENRRAARSAGGYKDDSKKQTDPSKDGFTGISGSIKDIMRQSAEMDKKKKQKSVKEEMSELAAAYRAVYSEEASDKKKDEHQERGGHAARTDYSKPPSNTRNTFGKKPDLTGEERKAAMDKIIAGIKKRAGKSTNEEVEEISEFAPAPAGSPIDRHSRGISKYDKRSERQIKMDNFASKRSKMMGQPKTP